MTKQKETSDFLKTLMHALCDRSLFDIFFRHDTKTSGSQRVNADLVHRDPVALCSTINTNSLVLENGRGEKALTLVLPPPLLFLPACTSFVFIFAVDDSLDSPQSLGIFTPNTPVKEQTMSLQQKLYISYTRQSEEKPFAFSESFVPTCPFSSHIILFCVRIRYFFRLSAGVLLHWEFNPPATDLKEEEQEINKDHHHTLLSL